MTIQISKLCQIRKKILIFRSSEYDIDYNTGYNSVLIAFKEKLINEKVLKDFRFWDNKYLMRFIRARKGDVNKSFNMFKDFIEFRRKYNVDSILNYSPKINKSIHEIFPTSYHKTDKNGLPIFINLMSKFDIDKMIKEIPDIDAEMYIIKDFEYQNKIIFPACSKVMGKYIETCITIIDIQNIGINFIFKNMKYAKMGGNITQNYYPENLSKMYVINANTLFSTLWNLVKNFIDEKTQKKIYVYKDDYLKHLLETIPIENLPKFLGGTCECKEGCMNSNAGIWNYE